MTKTHSLTISLAIALIGIAAATAPTQAATRVMSSSPDAFEYRCERHDGAFDIAGTRAICQTPTVPVTCEFVNGDQALCAWPGLQNQVAVIRVIGTLPEGYVAVGNGTDRSSFNGSAGSGNGGGGNGGGFKGPGDFQMAPDNNPNPNFNGPKDFQMAP
jgi:hypothetical protein